jgi:Protein of unknown function (DUF2818)
VRTLGVANAGYLVFVSTSLAVWLVLALALVAANLPFVSQRLLGVMPMRAPKSLGMRLLELLALYLVVGAAGLLLEQHAGQIAPQTWEFYAITVTLFLTIAFPGFVYRYLLKHRD